MEVGGGDRLIGWTGKRCGSSCALARETRQRRKLSWDVEPSRVTRTWAKPNNFYIEVKEGRKLRIGRWLLFLLTWSIWPAAEAAPFTDSKLWSILFFRIVGEISLLDCFIVVNLTTDNPDYLRGGREAARISIPRSVRAAWEIASSSRMSFSETVQWWQEWQLRILVLSSLFLQYFLFMSSIFRKRCIPAWVRFFIWLAYLGSDAMALYALATLFNYPQKNPSRR